MFGLVNLEEDEDRTIRRARLFYMDKVGHSHPSFARRAVEAAFPERERAYSSVAPIWIYYSVRPDQFTSISWKDVPARLSSTPELFRNRLVIAGATYSGNSDQHRVPRVASDQLVSGQFVQALIANTILAGNPIHEIRLWPCQIAVGLACLAAAAGMLCFPNHSALPLIASVVLLGGYGGLAIWIFRADGIMLPVVGPELTILLSMFAAWGLKSMLSAYPVTAP